MPSSLRKLTFNSLIYSTGFVIARLATFLLLPFYTNIFSPDQYGVISLAYAFMGFMGIILHYGLDAALMKYYVPADSVNRRRFVTTTIISYLITSGIFFLIIWLSSPAIDTVILGINAPKYILYIGGILTLDVLWTVPMLLLRCEERPFSFLVFTLVNAVSGPGLILYFVLYRHQGMEGVFLGQLLASVFQFVLTLPLTFRRMNWSGISKTIWQKLMRFGLPFLPSGIFAMIMQMADQYILKYLTDLHTVGLYGAGYKLGMLMLLIVTGFNASWEPFFLQESDTPGRPKIYAKIGTAVFALLGFLWILMVLWVDRIVRIQIGAFTVYSSQYWSGVDIVPWVALGYVFYAVYLLQFPGPFRTGQSKWIAISRGIGAGVNILLNLLFIPVWGAMGAAIATTVAFGIMAIYLYFVNKRIYPIPFELGRWLKISGLMGVLYLLYQYIPHMTTERILLTLAFPAGLFLLGLLGKDERTALQRLFRGDR